MSDQPAGGSGSRGRDAAARLAWDEAFEAFAEAADAGEHLEPSDLRTWGTAAYLLGQVDTALDVLAEAHRVDVERGDLTEAVRAGFWVAFMFAGRGDIGQASGWMARCERLLEDLPDGSDGNDYLLNLEAFRLVAIEQRYLEGRELADDIVTRHRGDGDPDLLALSLSLVGRACVRMGDPERGLAALDEAMVAVVSGELSPTAAGNVYCSLIEACEEIVEVRRAREWTDALSRWCDRQQGIVTFTGQCLTHRSTILRRHGRWEEAESEARRAYDRFMGAADEMAAGGALYQLGEIHRVAGDTEAAEEAYRRASEWGHDPQPGLALLRMAGGQAEAAAATMRRRLAEIEDGVARMGLLPAHVEIMIEVGDLESAASAADELDILAKKFQTPALRAQADTARGTVLLAQDDGEGSLAVLRRAFDGWRALEVPYEAARVRMLIGLACRLVGDDDTARLELDGARRVFQELGAVPALARLDETRSGGTSPDHPLSERELEVLRLVATGKTNKAIADDLFVAVKTVDRHVANILTKLGVPSRTAATAYAYERGLI